MYSLSYAQLLYYALNYMCLSQYTYIRKARTWLIFLTRGPPVMNGFQFKSLLMIFDTENLFSYTHRHIVGFWSQPEIADVSSN